MPVAASKKSLYSARKKAGRAGGSAVAEHTMSVHGHRHCKRDVRSLWIMRSNAGHRGCLDISRCRIPAPVRADAGQAMPAGPLSHCGSTIVAFSNRSEIPTADAEARCYAQANECAMPA